MGPQVQSEIGAMFYQELPPLPPIRRMMIVKGSLHDDDERGTLCWYANAMERERVLVEVIGKLKGALGDCVEDLEDHIRAKAHYDLPRNVAMDLDNAKRFRALLSLIKDHTP